MSRGRRQAASILEVGADDIGPERRKPGRLRVGRVPGGRAYRVPACQEQAGDPAESPRRSGDQDPPRGGIRYPVMIVR
jgi:hypothetical protein